MDEPKPAVFDEWGYLAPPGPHKDSLCNIRIAFVENMVPSESRPRLFQTMVGLIGTFTNLLHTDRFQVWIGGVFISNTPEPEDTNICLIISYETFNNTDEEIQKLILKFVHPETDHTKAAEIIHQKMSCDIHILLNETDPDNPCYLSCQRAKEMMDAYYHWDSAHHPCGYFICNAEKDTKNDTQNNA